MSQTRRFVQRWLVRVTLDLALLTGLWCCAAAVVRVAAPLWPEIPAWRFLVAALAWSLALLLSVPPLATAAHRLNAAAILFTEMRIAAAEVARNPRPVRAVVAGVLLLIGLQCVGLWLLGLLSLTRPPTIVRLALLLPFALGVWRAARSFVRFYAPQRPRAVPELRSFAEATGTGFELVTLTPDSAKSGPRLRVGQVQARTGARVAGIIRYGQSIPVPAPAVLLLPADQLVLAGTPSQLAAARALLSFEAHAARLE